MAQSLSNRIKQSKYSISFLWAIKKKNNLPLLKWCKRHSDVFVGCGIFCNNKLFWHILLCMLHYSEISYTTAHHLSLNEH